MKNFLLGTVAIVSIGAAMPASAADLPVKAPMMSAPAVGYNWTGLYIGAHLGGAFDGSDFFGNDNAQLMGGGQIGRDYQFAPSTATMDTRSAAASNTC